MENVKNLVAENLSSSGFVYVKVSMSENGIGYYPIIGFIGFGIGNKSYSDINSSVNSHELRKIANKLLEAADKLEDIKNKSKGQERLDFFKNIG